MSIPKTIHYCWLSGDPYPEDVKACIRSWEEKLPGYLIRLWDRERFDASGWEYAAEALAKKKYAFVSDVVRLFALYTEGGIYLDSDIMVETSFDDLLDREAFTGFESGLRIGPWLIASEKGNPVIGELLEEYDHRTFLQPDGSMDMTPNTVPVTRTLAAHGLLPENKKQELEHITIFPEEYFCPYNPWTGITTITSNTHARHLFHGAWNDSGKDDMEFLSAIPTRVKDFVAENRDEISEKGINLYGTGVVASQVLEQMRQNGVEPEGFIVTQYDNLWRTFGGVPVRKIAEIGEVDKDTPVLIATNPKHYESIMMVLMKNQFTNFNMLSQEI